MSERKVLNVIKLLVFCVFCFSWLYSLFLFDGHNRRCFLYTQLGTLCHGWCYIQSV